MDATLRELWCDDHQMTVGFSRRRRRSMADRGRTSSSTTRGRRAPALTPTAPAPPQPHAPAPTDTAAEADGTSSTTSTDTHTEACEIHELRDNSGITPPPVPDTSGDAPSIPGVPGTHDAASTDSVITVSGTNDTEGTGDADLGSVGASLSTDMGETSSDGPEDGDNDTSNPAQRLAALPPSAHSLSTASR